MPVFALLFAVFCGELQAGVMLRLSDDMQAGLQITSSQNSATMMAGNDEQEDDSAPFVDVDSSDLEVTEEPGSQVVSVACGALDVKWASHRVVTLTVSRERLILPPLTPSCLLKVPILGLSSSACSR